MRFARPSLASSDRNRADAYLAVGLAVIGNFGMYLFLTYYLQDDYQAAAGGGALSFAVTLVAGAVVTPVGEGFFFRGVIADALQRYRAWIGVTASAVLFAIDHGINPVMPVALLGGVMTALLLYKTGSVWSGVVAHGSTTPWP